MSIEKLCDNDGTINAVIIAFENEETHYELQLRLFTQNQSDRLEIMITGRNDTEFYYQSTFSMETLPKDFILIYDSLPELYDYIVLNFGEVLEISFDGARKETASLKVKVLIIKKMREFKLPLPKKPITEEMKEEASLKKLNNEIKVKEQILSEKIAQENQITKQMRINEKSISMEEINEKNLIESLSNLMEAELAQKEKNQEINNKIETKRKNVEQLYTSLIRQGFQFFTKEEKELFNKVVRIYPEQITYKKMRCDFEKEIRPKESSKNKPNFQDEQSKQKQQKPAKQTDLIPVSEPSVNMESTLPNFHILQLKKSSIDNKKSNEQPKIQFEQDTKGKCNKRMLRISDDNSDNQSEIMDLLTPVQAHIEQQQHKEPNESINVKIQSFASTSPHHMHNNQMNGKPFVTVLSSQSQEEQPDDYTRNLGKRVCLDFTTSQHLSNYKIQSNNTRTSIERVLDDKKYYHLYHKDPVRNKQYMEICISNIMLRDLNFGIMGKNCLKVPRMEWPKEVCLWLGCHREIINQMEIKKIEPWLEASDSVTVAVDVAEKTIKFFHNKKLVHTEKVTDRIINECYFFFETATAGNKVYYA